MAIEERVRGVLQRHGTRVAALFMLLYIGALSAVVLVPSTAENRSEMDENSMSPGSATTIVGDGDVRAEEVSREALDALFAQSDAACRLSDMAPHVAAHLRAVGLRTYTHTFTPAQESSGHGAGAWGEHESGTVVYAVVRAARGEGKEAAVLHAVAGVDEDGAVHTCAAASAIVVAKALHDAQWMSKDVLLVLTDACHKHHEGYEAWLEMYHHTPHRYAPATLPMHVYGGLLRGSVSVEDTPHVGRNELEVLPHGYHGQLPNMDLVNALVRVSFRARVNARIPSLAQPRVLKPFISRLAWQRVEQLLAFVAQRVRGAPSGAHGHALTYSIDALTARISPHKQRDGRVLRTLEGIMRALSNIGEKLHHSQWMYWMYSVHRHAPLSAYLVPAIVLAALPLLVCLARVYVHPAGTARLGRAAVVVAVAFGACGAVTSAPWWGLSHATELHNTHALWSWAAACAGVSGVLVLAVLPWVTKRRALKSVDALVDCADTRVVAARVSQAHVQGLAAGMVGLALLATLIDSTATCIAAAALYLPCIAPALATRVSWPARAATALWLLVTYPLVPLMAWSAHGGDVGGVLEEWLRYHTHSTSLLLLVGVPVHTLLLFALSLRTDDTAPPVAVRGGEGKEKGE